MATPEKFLAWLAAAETKTYYEILRVPRDVTAEELKQAFHTFALACHPDRAVEEAPEVASAAAEVFKRGVEAYRVLGRPELRGRYDRAVAKGKFRLDDKRVESVPPPPQGKTLEMVARTKRGKELATKADRFLTIGKLEDARLLLTTAVQQEPHNKELSDRLKLIYEALALEPL
jgi:curved DNA-binding protein CbpA